MFGMYDRSFLKIKNVKDLWKKELQFRKFIIAMIFVLSIILIIFAVKVILTFILKNDFTHFLIELDINGNKVTQNEANGIWFRSIMQDLTYLIISLGLLISYIVNIKQAYKIKSFEKISFFSVFFPFVIILISGWDIMRYGYYLPYLNFIILSIINLSFNLLAYIFVVNQVSLIRKAFVAASRFEAQQKIFNELFKNASNNSQGNSFTNPFTGFPFMQQNNENVQNSNTNNDNVDSAEIVETPEEKEKNKQIKKLLDLPNEKLYKMAELIGIYGYKEMSKEELAEKIYIYTQQNKK
ncbi:hypothetical protein [Mycoplasmopsis cricetuli]|uniref:hypothetical protein n=1 Tax=Mycoplasmopsis cricetuli TaxID=171283 RepID=UPI0004700B5C|nr:hypothetical protein [Mycoplasmopsis cricetuli]